LLCCECNAAQVAFDVGGIITGIFF